MQEYLLAKVVLGLLYKYAPEVIPALSIDFKNIDLKNTMKYLRYFSSKSIPDDIMEEFKTLEKIVDNKGG